MFRSKKLYRALALSVGLIGLAACADTPPPPAPMAATDGPQLAGAWYQVYFATDSTEINPRGQMIIQTVANVVKQDNLVRVTIIGKTDSVGSSSANNVLSQNRADKIRDALISNAVPADRIATNWTGEGKQEMVTADNVPEQRNRVVDIAVQRPF